MNFIKKIKRFLTSPGTVIALIIITLATCIVGFFVPQVTEKSPAYFELWKEKNIYTYRLVDRLQLNRVFTSYWFLTLVVLTTASLGYSLYLQIKRNLRQVAGSGTENSEHRPQAEEKLIFIDKDRDWINSVLKKRGYDENRRVSNNQRLVFSKNTLGKWGGVLFHSGLLLVIIAAITVLCFQKRGFVQLIEGELFDGRDISFLVKNKGVMASEFNTGFQTHLTRLEHSYWKGGNLKLLESSMEIIRGNEKSDQQVSINNPLSVDRTSIYQSNDYGYALSFILKRPSGKEIVSHFTINRAGNLQKYAAGKSDYPLTPYIFEMKFMPDISGESFHIKKPILNLTVFEGETVVFNGLVIPKDSVKIRDDILYFADVRYWSGLIFVNNPGIVISYIGFVIGIIGAAVMFFIPYKQINMTMNAEAGSYEISGTAHRYQALFMEELGELKKEIGAVK